ncbi:MAG: tetratricopeptide repeat protein [Candidatus Hydrogenedentes bacterium]|nr:tetratricopeptide repeat protein [Candidatus Hydrogenedentota bacterium]
MAKENKADLEELSEYVIVHPDDSERRWMLAKKLYMAWEYNDALKHLLILKKNWARKLNVLRYLAATYYRLGLYDEAITELRAITELWPNEVAVWEQLARVYEVAGRNAEAANAWEQIVRISPSHPIAARSVQRLRTPSGDLRRDDLRLRDSDSGIDLSPYRICKNCGAQNSDEFERCWQCHSALHNDEGPIDSVHAISAVKNNVWVRTLAGGMSTVAALSASVYVTLHTTRTISEGTGSAFGPVYDALAETLLFPRIICAAVLAIVWPIALWIGFRATGGRPLPWPSLCGSGLLLASLAYLAMWAPIPWLMYAPLVPAAASLAVILAFSGTAFGRGIGAWLAHGVLVVVSGVGGFAAAAGIQPILQLPAIVDYNAKMMSVRAPGSVPIFTTETTGGRAVIWSSTGSTWLDQFGNAIIIVADIGGAEGTVSVSLMSGDEPIGTEGPVPNSIKARVLPDVSYKLHVSGPTGLKIDVVSKGALQPRNALEESP